MSTENRFSSGTSPTRFVLRAIQTACLISPALIACILNAISSTYEPSEIMWKSAGISASTLLLFSILCGSIRLLFKAAPQWATNEAGNFLKLSLLMLVFAVLFAFFGD